MATPKPYDHDHENEVQLFAKANFRSRSVRFGIKTDDRRRHVYVIGKSGMGKTTLLENMILSDIHAGHGCCYIDPHGDTAQNILDYIPSNRINDVVYFNPADTAFPIGFNILESVDPEKKHLVAAGLMAVFKKIWPDVWSARMEYILVNTILALLDVPGSTLLGINRLYVDEEYRKRVVSLIQDPVVKTFWVKEFAAFSEKYRTEAVAPVQNKVGQFMSASIIRNIVAQVKSTIDMRDIMDNRKILIVNLSKGLIGEENMHLLGGMIITRLQLAAMERVDIPEKDRQDFYMYVDEFQNFANESFATILSEARKYRLGLIMAHQYIEQLDEKVCSAIFGNVGTMISFRVGGPDAQELEKEFAPYFTPEDLIGLSKYDIYLRLLIDGVASTPFSATTLPPIAEKTNSTEKVIKVSRERYAVPRKNIEENVIKWSGFGSGEAGGEAEVETPKQPSSKPESAAGKSADKPESESGDDKPAEGDKDFFMGDENLEEKVKELQASSPYVGEMAKSVDGGFGQKKKKEVKHEVPCSVCGAIQKLTFDPDWSKPWFCKEHLELRNTPMARKLPSIAKLTGKEMPARNADRPPMSGGDDRRMTPRRPDISQVKPIEIAGGDADKAVSLDKLKSSPPPVKDRPAAPRTSQPVAPSFGAKGKPRITVTREGDSAADELRQAVVPEKRDKPAEPSRATQPLTSPVVGKELRSGRPESQDRGANRRNGKQDRRERQAKDNKPRITVSREGDSAADELRQAVVPENKRQEPTRGKSPLTSPVVEREISAPPNKPEAPQRKDESAKRSPASESPVAKPASAPALESKKPEPRNESRPLTSPVVEREISAAPARPKVTEKTDGPTMKSSAPTSKPVDRKDSAPVAEPKQAEPKKATPPLTSPIVEKELDKPSDKPKLSEQPASSAKAEQKPADQPNKQGDTPIEPAAQPDKPKDGSFKGDLPSVGGYDDTSRSDDSWKPGQVIKF